MALATLFVTMPFVARELIPILEAMDMAQEEAARTLGASDFEVSFRKWHTKEEGRCRLVTWVCGQTAGGGAHPRRLRLRGESAIETA